MFKSFQMTAICGAMLIFAGVCVAQPVSLTYILSNGNQTSVNAGDTLTFPATLVGVTNSATFVITNQGATTVQLSSVVISGSTSFSIRNLTQLPTSIASQQNVTFNIVFQPTSTSNVQGSLTLNIGGSAIAISLAGQGTGAVLTYAVTAAGSTTSITPGQTLKIADTQVSQTTKVSVTVTNTGNGPGQIGNITVTGAGFQVGDLPPLPFSIAPQGVMTFTLQFTPTDSGSSSGQLRIDNALFPVSSVGLGPKFALSVQIAGTPSSVPDNSTIDFPNAVVGTQTAAVFTISNVGNQPLTISNIAATGNDFTAGALPQLPLVLQPNQSSTFSVTFEPDSLAILTGSLLVSGHLYTLRGSGSAPPAPSTLQFGNVPSQVSPLQQPSISLQLAQPYPYDIAGQLSLSFASNSFVDDPSIQFASGGRAVSFTIPANSTNALFGTNTNMPFQSGTVTGTITFSAVLMVRNVNITPVAPTTTVLVTAGPPQIQRIGLGNQTATSFELLITGYAPTRQVTQIQFQFTPAPGATLQSQTLTVDTTSPFNTWYQSTGSQQFGSQFTASVTILVSGKITDVQSATATAVNSQGTSSPASVNLR